MRIAIDCRKIDDYGIGRYIRGLLGGFAAIRATETFLLIGPRALEGRIPPGLQAEWIEADAPPYSIREALVIGRAARRAGSHLFHAPHYVVPLVSGPVAVTIHDLIHLEIPFRNPLKPLYARTMLRRAATRSSAILTVSRAVQRQIAARWPDAADKIETVPNGVDSLFFAPRRPGDEGEVAAMGLEADRYFLFVGNDKPHKNLDGLVAAWREVRRELPQSRLAIAGSSPRRFEGEEGVVLAGFVGEPLLARLYRCATALVMPSFAEGFGLPVAEAMASGTPVICSDVEAMLEVAGEAARRIDPADPRSIAEAMLALARDPALRETMIHSGRARANELRWERAARRTLAVYRAAAREPKTSTERDRD
ncbi:MAG TPA: glycosyltransferase family 1 protein [Thermoanaerobaculia bacterium]|nr:glycosyltransferase family 1 protein [Thermoanaerobaculia bacterium]